jgi:hypothetical protein
MKRRRVDSSSVRSVGYDVDRRILEIEFEGGIYQYLDVPQPVYAGLMAAPSIGAYVNAEIKPYYRYREVR